MLLPETCMVSYFFVQNLTSLCSVSYAPQTVLEKVESLENSQLLLVTTPINLSCWFYISIPVDTDANKESPMTIWLVPMTESTRLGHWRSVVLVTALPISVSVLVTCLLNMQLQHNFVPISGGAPNFARIPWFLFGPDVMWKAQYVSIGSETTPRRNTLVDTRGVTRFHLPVSMIINSKSKVSTRRQWYCSDVRSPSSMYRNQN